MLPKICTSDQVEEEVAKFEAEHNSLTHVFGYPCSMADRKGERSYTRLRQSDGCRLIPSQLVFDIVCKLEMVKLPPVAVMDVAVYKTPRRPTRRLPADYAEMRS